VIGGTFRWFKKKGPRKKRISGTCRGRNWGVRFSSLDEIRGRRENPQKKKFDVSSMICDATAEGKKRIPRKKKKKCPASRTQGLSTAER